MSTQPIIAAADGSALGNPGPAGWAWYVSEDCWAAGGWEHGTNNMGELKAVLDLFESTAHVPQRPLHIYCDSQYTINAVTQWMPGWKKKGWKKRDGKPVLNQDLLKALDAALVSRTYTFEWVKGHAGHTLNEKVDDLARAAATAYQQGRKPDTGPGFAKVDNSVTSAETHGGESAPCQQLVRVADGGADDSQISPTHTVDPRKLGAELDQALQKNIHNHRELGELLATELLWVTPAGRRVSRDLVIEHSVRALTYGKAQVIRAELLTSNRLIVVARVETPRGQIIRTSIWAKTDRWQLTFRQETALT